MATTAPTGVKGFLAKAFPFISAAASLGGPPAVIAANLLGKALGVNGQPTKVSSTEEGIISALSTAAASPDQLAAAQKVESDLKAQMQQAGFADAEEMVKLATDDRASARQMQIAVRSKVPAILAAVVTMGYFIVLTGIMRGFLKLDSNQALVLLLGSLSTSWGMVIAYYFGSSSGSDRKTELLAQAPAIPEPR